VFAPDERTIYTVAQDGTVASWDLTGRRGFGTWAPVPAGAEAAAASPDGSRLLLGNATGQVTVLGPALSTQRQIKVTGAVTALAVSPDGRLAAAGTQQGTVTIVDLGTGAVITRTGGLHAVSGVAWSPDGRLLAATDQQAHRVRIISAATWQTAATFGVPAPPAFGIPSPLGQVAWSADGRLLAIGVAGSSVEIADPRTGRLLRRLWAGRDPVTPSVAFTRGSVLAVGARDGSVRFWDAATGKPVSDSISGTTGYVQQLSASRDGRLVAASGDDGSLVLLDAAHYRRLAAALPPPAGTTETPVLGMVDSSRARLVAIYSNGEAAVWPLDPARWLARACAVPGRHLSPAEWRLYLGTLPYDPAC
jgi:WD40 repeat protein